MNPLYAPCPFGALKHLLLSFFTLVFGVITPLLAETKGADVANPDILPVVGFAIAAPKPDAIDDFLKFMRSELAENGVNTLLLRVDFNYEYTSFPNLRSDNPLSSTQVKQIVETARECEIRLIPHINLLGHQSWHSELGKLLEEYPEFDETPGIQLPEPGTYEWPNEDGLYCKSYCPLHPDVHEVVFALVDEIVEAFEADAFHPGLDEVFYIGHENCSRCAGMDKAQLFAGEVNKIHHHLSRNGVEMWMWGDRLIDGITSGIGEWEASTNDTAPAIDLISKDIVICDWHYERALPTPVWFAMKGFRVVACPWNKGPVASKQVEMMAYLRKNSSDAMNPRYLGMMQTIWTSAERYLKAVDGATEDESLVAQVRCFEAMIDAVQSLHNPTTAGNP